MPTGIYIRTKKIKEALRNRRVPARTKEWKKNIGDALRKGKNFKCVCGKEFFVHRYRFSIARFCSRKCRGKYGPSGLTKGKKIPKGSLAKLGDKNPMFGKKRTSEQIEKTKRGMKEYWDNRGRVSKEHKRIVKKVLDYKRKSTIKGSFSPKEWQDLKEKYNFICPCCGKEESEMKWKKLTVDHIVPLSKEGTNTIENIQPLCLSCNCKKNNREIIKYEIIQGIN